MTNFYKSLAVTLALFAQPATAQELQMAPGTVSVDFDEFTLTLIHLNDQAGMDAFATLLELLRVADASGTLTAPTRGNEAVIMVTDRIDDISDLNPELLVFAPDDFLESAARMTVRDSFCRIFQTQFEGDTSGGLILLIDMNHNHLNWVLPCMAAGITNLWAAPTPIDGKPNASVHEFITAIQN